MSAGFDWNDQNIERLRNLWADGLSTAKIAVELKTSKNAVVGKAHRLNLPRRPDCIQRTGSVRVSPPTRKQSAQALQTLSPALVIRQGAAPAPPRITPPVSAQPSAAAKTGRCCWPIGELRTPEFRFCNEPCGASKSYCDEHHRRSVKPAGQDGASFKAAGMFFGGVER